MKLGKSPGTDQISAEITIAGKEIFQEELYEIFSLAWKTEEIPEEWTKSIIVVIPKKVDQSECTNCRTLSLMNHLLKMLLLIVD